MLLTSEDLQFNSPICKPLIAQKRPRFFVIILETLIFVRNLSGKQVSGKKNGKLLANLWKTENFIGPADKVTEVALSEFSGSNCDTLPRDDQCPEQTRDKSLTIT